MSFETYIVSVMKNRPGVLPSVLRLFLLTLSFFYRFSVSLRRFAYQAGIFSSHKLSMPVISVGNIVAGGTGKTPFTLMLVQAIEKEFKSAILTRGYRSKIKESSLAQGKEADEIGDEPVLLQKNLSNSIVIVGPNRLKSSLIAKENGAQSIFLEDGLQHLKIKRDIDIILIDAKDPMGGGYFLPRGFLRESPKNLKRADLIVVTHYEDPEIKKIIRKWTCAPIVSTRVELNGVYDLQGNSQSVPDKIALFSAIAKPERFRESVASKFNSEIVAEMHLKDHEKFDGQKLQEFAKKAFSLGAKQILCTEKDYVKMNPRLSCQLPIAWVKMQLEVIDGQEHLDHLIQNIKQLIVVEKTA